MNPISVPISVLILIDSPTLATGFARVGQNLIPPWLAAGVKIDVWGIGFNGFGYDAWPGVRLFPGGLGGQWNSTRMLQDFLQQLSVGKYTHLFILQDTFQFSPQFCHTLQHVCSQRNIRSVMYFPVDATLEPEWTAILGSVDVPVAYTAFGKAEAELKAAMAQLRFQCQVLPHGVNPEIYQPRSEARAHDRKMWQVGPKEKLVVFVKPDDFLMLNVNTNQWRKDGARSLEILAELLRRGVPAKLVMHCRKATPYGQDLEATGRQLGLQLWRDWVHSDSLFGPGDGTFLGYDTFGKPLIGSSVNEHDLARMYNAADLVLSTSLGEGWGFSFTEALACGTPVALPDHTSCAELYKRLHELDGESGSSAASPHRPSYVARQLCLLPARDKIVMPGEMSRVRNRVEMPEAADAIENYWKSGYWRERHPLPAKALEWMSWPRIAGEMLKLLLGEQPTEKPVTEALQANQTTAEITL